ncbi:MAG: methyltransferase, partial [Ruminococcus sp.]
MLNKNEHLEPLGKGIKIIVSDIHHFSTDTILLSNFACPKRKDRVIELGTGCGTIPLLMKKDNRNLE